MTSRARIWPASVAVTLVIAAAGTARAQDRSGVRPEVMALPARPGSIEGLGESFDASPQSGAASYRVPIRVPPAVAGFAPSLALSYSSGGGNGELGLGWSLGLPAVQRSTDRRLPAYDDSDVFVLRGMGGAGAEDLAKQSENRIRRRGHQSVTRHLLWKYHGVSNPKVPRTNPSSSRGER